MKQLYAYGSMNGFNRNKYAVSPHTHSENSLSHFQIFRQTITESLKHNNLEDVLAVDNDVSTLGNLFNVKLISTTNDSEYIFRIPVGSEYKTFAKAEDAINTAKAIIHQIVRLQKQVMPTHDLEQNYLSLSSFQQATARKAYAVVATGNVIHQQQRKYEQKMFTTKTVTVAQINQPDKFQVARLVLAGLTIHETVKSLFCKVPDTEHEFNTFIKDIKTLPQDWFNELYSNKKLYQND